MTSSPSAQEAALPKDPLNWMQRLSPSVSYFVPPKTVLSDEKTERKDPELILVLSWMGAKEEHIFKYIEGHRATFPNSRIILARCPLTHVFAPWLGWVHVQPIIPLLKEILENDTDNQNTSGPPKVLLHAFSNGGVSTAIQIYMRLKAQLGGKLVLPRNVFIFDSCPGTFKWRCTARALGQTLPWWTSPIIHTTLAMIWLFYRLPFLQPAQNRNARAIRNPMHKQSEVRRTYLYGTNDNMIPPSDVEDQARQAAKDGFLVRTEKFQGARHCAIAKTDPDRYWRVVRETWDGPIDKINKTH